MSYAQPTMSIGGFFGLGGSDLSIGEMAKALDGSSKGIVNSACFSTPRSNFCKKLAQYQIDVENLLG